MATTTSGVDYKSAPEDYAALYRIYYPFVVNLVAKNGIDDNNKEDVANEILTRLIEKRFLEQFNPDLQFEYDGQWRPARFKTFLGRAVVTYTRGHYDRQNRRARREYQICDMSMDNSEASAHGDSNTQSWADLYGEPVRDHADDVIEMVNEQQLAEGLRTYLATCPKRSAHDTCDLVEVFDAVREQILATGNYDVKALQEQFHISTTTMHNWLWWLKKNLATALGKQAPPKRRRVLGTKKDLP